MSIQDSSWPFVLGVAKEVEHSLEQLLSGFPITRIDSDDLFQELVVSLKADLAPKMLGLVEVLTCSREPIA